MKEEKVEGGVAKCRSCRSLTLPVCHWLLAKRGPVNKGTVERGETVTCTCCVMAWDVR